VEFAIDEATLTNLQNAELDITVQVKSKINVTPFIARQKINVLILEKAGTGLLAESPVLVAVNGRLCWRVPVVLSLPGHGRLGEVGAIDVNMQTSEILISPSTIATIIENANQLAQRATL
jgi:hypothetical protein